jgi:hypothetical protein
MKKKRGNDIRWPEKREALWNEREQGKKLNAWKIRRDEKDRNEGVGLFENEMKEGEV